ncbi:Rv1355c family protein [Pedobacter nanyangensis]|uniref:Rv1355c family protein n=1 Tax=Pedobacter nanyangensis TaxID=1562389 RepID=UPI000DE2D64F|nr:Rv1355c family protein [Pedobacter nanyangensis]
MHSKAAPHSLKELIGKTQKLNDIYKPIKLNLSNQDDLDQFDKILTNQPNIQVYDTIKLQVKELVKCLQPFLALNPASVDEAVERRFADTPQHAYGNWFYYPWSNKLVHLLNEEEFTIVRTNRNKYKITAEEQQALATKKIGVMGLSVGQSVSLTLAMERGFGELRIADFDELDLSNINRIRTGTHNIQLKKTVIVAREIAEIDPYLNVVCYHEGITEDNVHQFLTQGGKLDLLIDECDSFDIKINSRKIARQLQIPVLMEGSDRGTIDIERFDLEPQRPILHGLVEHLDMEKFSSLKTFDEKIPYITAVTGLETLSPRMKASAVELMATISTWPQLASAVTFGGGVSADLSRKILLNSLKISGRFFLDLDELIADPPLDNAPKQPETEKQILSVDDITAFISENELDNWDHTGKELSEDELLLLINAAKQAPSGGNNQPWRFHYQHKQLHLFLEESATGAYLDPQHISSYTSIGAAIENLLLTAATQHLAVNWQLTPQLAPKHLAIFSFSDGTAPSEQEKTLQQQISTRHTNRKAPPKQEISDADMQHLCALVAQTKGPKLTFVKDAEKINALSKIATQADLLRMFIPEAHEDFITREMRWTPAEAHEREDGIGIHTLDLSNNDQSGIRMLRDRRMIDFLQKIKGGSAFGRLLSQQFNTSSAIGLITIPHNDVSNWIDCGIAAERMWLGATHLEFQIHPVNVPLIFFYKNSIEKKLPLTEEIRTQLIKAEKELNIIFDGPENQIPAFMFRIFKASASPERTIRKSNNKIFSIGRA